MRGPLVLVLILAVPGAGAAAPLPWLWPAPTPWGDAYHGVAHLGSDDDARLWDAPWTGFCTTAITRFELTLTVTWSDPEAVLSLVTPGGVAEARAGEPATVVESQADGCVDFRVLGTWVPGVARYRVDVVHL